MNGMKKLIMWNVVTLDGRFEGEQPWDLSFHELVWGPELEAVSIAQLAEASMLVFGENTYKGMADYWTKKFVFSCQGGLEACFMPLSSTPFIPPAS